MVTRHRIITASQLHRLTGIDAGHIRRTLARLQRQRIVASRPASAGRTLLWYPRTEAGRRHAHGQNVAHTLRLNDAGLAFVAAARARGHECGPLAWHHEVHLEKVTADADLEYHDDHGPILRFIELDRGTETVGFLRRKVGDYAEMAKSGTWRARYETLPHLIVVFADCANPGRRMAQVMAACEAEPAIMGSQLPVSFTTLDLLRSPGPWAPIFARPGQPAAVDLLGQA